MIKVILFDVGNVLLEFNPEAYHKESMDHKIYKEVEHILFSGNTWHEYDKGVYSTDDIKEIFIQKAPHLKNEIIQVIDSVTDLLNPIHEIIDFAMECKKDYRISILSNMPEESGKYIVENFDFLNEFEYPLYSYLYKLVKPNDDIYLLQLERLNIQANECIFIDDKQENIDTANRLGIHGVLMTNPTETIESVKKILKQQEV